ncbi:TonB C-terminal domain-containing protein [Novosphingobium sp. CF614]|uniref:TonB C-terminal domain-containing protein n=1 Tax=Novosphingobium sp. CF614 TaxID=1884364 RepID=UPI002101B7BE|nr:TonB C-terminal domain-containing protein [Novosphingobium sp. CF614]
MRKQEGIGLFVAVALHAAVLAILLIRLPHHAVVKPPERVEVTISDEVGMTSTSPDPRSQAAPDSAPELGEPAPEAPPVPEIAPEPAPLPLQPAPRPVEAPRPKPTPKPAPKAIQKPKPAEQAPPRNSSSRKSSAIDAIVSQPNRASPSSSKAKAPPKKSGGSSFAEAFKQGTPDAKSASGSGAPAAAIGPKQVSALVAAVNRQLKPHWQAPQGADADLLVTRVRFRLNRDGSLAGEPQVLSTSGQTPANQAQVQRHQEQAVRAIKLAAPFSLPDDLYDGWKIVTTNFDRRLSQ